ncbi:efflux RND transporter periplasmic adaptor subunit [Vibrio sp.]|nr:efflux RND transporter periplasmic adaptor subunit [Vibrio sp.]
MNNKNRRVSSLFIPTLLSSTLFISGCGEEKIAPSHVTPKVKITSTTAIEGSGSGYLTGVAYSADRTKLSFQISGELKKIHVKEGMLIKKGEAVAQLDPQDLILTLEKAEAKYSAINSQFKRSKPLVKKKLLAQSKLDELEAEKNIAYADLLLAKLKLSYATLTAPFDGVVSHVDSENFENIAIGQPVVTISRPDFIEVEVPLPSQFFSDKTSHDPSRVKDILVNFQNDQSYKATIDSVTTEPDPNTGTYLATLRLPTPQKGVLYDGQAVEVTGKDANQLISSSISVPIESLVNSDGDALDRDNKFVWVLKEDNTVSKTHVQIGQAFGQSISIIAGLEPNDRIVISGLSRLREGLVVDVIDSASALDFGDNTDSLKSEVK